MEAVKCVNERCQNYQIEVACPSLLQVVPGVGARLTPVCLGCGEDLWRCEPRPIHLMLTERQGVLLARLLSGMPGDMDVTDHDAVADLRARLIDASP